MIYGRDVLGRFITKNRAKEQEESVRKTMPSAKIVIFKERIKGTRIARVVRRAYPVEETDDEIARKLQTQYDNGGNYVLNITSIGLGYLKPGDEFELERGKPGSADVSP